MSETIGRWSGAVATAAFLLVGALLSERPPVVVAATLLVSLAGLVPYARRSPDAVTVLAGAALSGLGLVVLCTGPVDSSSNIGWFGLCTVMVMTSSVVTWRGLVVAATCCLAVIGAQAAISPDPGWLAWTGGVVLTFVACWAIEREQGLVTALREAQAGLADRSRTEERTRIAREMHDVMGHALTVSLLHITAARLAVEEEPEVAAASLAEAERLSRRSLEEVRAAVGVLRDGSPPETPLPGAGDLPALVSSVARSGVAVTLSTTGDLAALSEVAGLAAYRIVQEALTNVVRHAPAATTTVHVAVTGSVLVRVDSTIDGSSPGRTATAGSGLAGMRERAEALGGTLVAGPGGPGWRVEATWPLRSAGILR